MSGKLLVFEGPDGVGKTTLSKLAADLLTAAGQPTKWLSFPGRELGTLGHLVYEVHHRPQQFNIAQLTEGAKQALHIAAHLDTIERQIKPWLASGMNVVLDRFWWSTWVYGLTAGLDANFLQALIDVERHSWNNTLPACIVLIKTAGPRDRAEEDFVNWQALAENYRLLAARESSTFAVRVYDNSSSVAEAQEFLKSTLSSFFAT
jgi:dTMP kinase